MHYYMRFCHYHNLLLSQFLAKFPEYPVGSHEAKILSHPGYVLLFGLLLCFSVTFLLVLQPFTPICALQRFSIGLCLSIVYTALLVKTNRIQRIFNSGQKSSKKIGFISPSSQLAICRSLVLVQVILNLVWLITSLRR